MPRLIEEGLSLSLPITQENLLLGSWQKQEILSCLENNNKCLEQPLKNAVADSFPFVALYDLINKQIPALDTNEAIEHFVLQLGCKNAFEKIKEQEYEIHAQADAKKYIFFY